MKKILSAFAITIIMLPAAAQPRKIISPFTELVYHQTIYDKTSGNNPWGIGLGLQTMVNTGEKLKLLIDLSAFTYLQDDKVYRTDENDQELPDVRSMVNIFAGVAYHASSTRYFSLVAGPSFVGGQKLFAVKPAFGFYFSPAQRWKGQISFVNVFNRGIEGSKRSFGSLSFAVGLRLF